MKFTKKLMSAFLLLSLTLSLLSGCGADTHDSDPEPTDLCVLIGSHQHFAVVNVNALHDQIFDACYSYGSVSAVVVDGQGQFLFDQTIRPPQAKVDHEKRRQIAEANTSRILQALSTAAAQAPETDPLSALAMGCDILAAKNSPRKELVMIDSLLSTTGLLDLTASNLLEQDPEQVVAELESRHSIPNLSDVDVSIFGLGQVCGEQARLTADYSYKLQALWQAIFSASGCRSVEFSSAPIGNTAPEGLPHVSCVPVVTDSLSFASAEAIPEVIRFDETSLKFYGDRADLIDPGQAEELVRPIAEALRSSPRTTVLLVGTTASTGSDGMELSRARAETVKALLLEAGVGEAQVTCLGLGAQPNPLRVNDLDSQGRLIEELARLNRAVYLLQGPAAQQLMDQIGDVAL